MKNTTVSYLILSLSLALFSCSKEEGNRISEEGPNTAPVKDVHTRSISPEAEDYLVTQEDIEAYGRYLNLLKKKENSVVSIEPVYYDNTLAYYIINLEKGWQIVSSDKRGPIILGQSDTGHFSREESDYGVETLLGFFFDDIEFRRNYPEQYYDSLDKEGQEQEENCIRTWKLINADHDYLAGSLPETKVVPPDTPLGDYVLIDVYQTYQIDSVSHLMSTHWDQRDPYNRCCPKDLSNNRCPAGCVAIAGSQVLYYLHNAYGYPTSSPTSGDYNYYYFNNPTLSFSNYSTSTWSQMMNISSNDYLALFVADIARLSDTHFHPYGSAGYIEDFYNDALQTYGVSATYTDVYNAYVIYQNLKSGFPVIYGGSVGVNEVGHAWVIDGYIEEQTVTHYVYEWVFFTPPTGHVFYPPVTELEVVTGSSLLYFKMNWGEANDDNKDDAWYATNGSWGNPYVNGSDPYIYDREIVYGWSSLNN